jgi:amidase
VITTSKSSKASAFALGQRRKWTANNPGFATVHELAAAIRERRVSAVEVLEAHLARIARYNPALNAIVTLNQEGARARAREADAALARGQVWGPLHGVPVTIKDSFSTAGIRTTSGFPPLANYIPDSDATVVARLRAAGAIVLGKTNLPLLVHGFQTDNPVFGRTNNPWNLARTPGGSTGGGAAAVAAGLSPLEVGSDYGGSVRIPAHFCGIYSLKPTDNRIPLTGHIPELPGRRGVRHVATPGPLARCVQDLTLALQVMAGPDPWYPDVPPVALTPVSEPSWNGLRVAWIDDFGGIATTRETQAALAKLVAALQERGCTVVRRLPDNFDFPGIWETYGELRQCEVGGAMPPEMEQECAANFGVSAQSDDPEVRGMARRLNASLRQYTATLAKRDAYIAGVEQFFEAWDVLLCPVTVGPAFPHCAPGTPIAVDEGHVPYRLGGTGYTSPFNLTGNPVVVLPLTRSNEGLPIGLQLVGRRWGEMKLLAVAERIAELTIPFDCPPGY